MKIPHKIDAEIKAHIEALKECHERIRPHIHRTPVLTSRTIDSLVGGELYFKCENFQRMGAYKIRGAMNAVLSLPESKRKHGVVTHSSGNFAQALALAANTVGIKAYIVMPSNAPEVKKRAVRAYGGEIELCEPIIEARQITADRIQKERGATFIHPSNDLSVIIGQGTACRELLQDIPDLAQVVVPVGGGGIIAGSAIAAAEKGMSAAIIGAEPFEVDDAYRSLKSGKIEGNLTTNTIADGLRTVLGDKNFPIILKLVSGIIRVTEEEIAEAMKLIWERMKIVVEPSSAVTLAAILRSKQRFAGSKTGVIITGGNVDLTHLPF